MDMDTLIENIINKLKRHLYPDNAGFDEYLDSWGVGFELTENCDENIFDIHRGLQASIIRAKQHLCEIDKNSPEPQLILDYKRGNWVLNFEFYIDGGILDDRFSMIAIIDDEDKVYKFIKKVIEAGINFSDVNGKVIN